MSQTNKRPRFSGIRLQALAVLNLRSIKLHNILNSGKKIIKGVEKPITELDIEKFGYQLEKCEDEISRLLRVDRGNKT